MPDTLHLEPVAIAPLRNRHGSLLASIGPAIERGGFDDAQAIHYRPATNDAGVLVGIVDENDVDGRSNPDARSLAYEGGTVRAAIPPKFLRDVLAIDPEQVDPDAPPQLLLLAGDGVVAFERVSRREIVADRSINSGTDS